MSDFIRGLHQGLEAKGASPNQGKTKQRLIKLLCPLSLALVISQTLYSTSCNSRSILAEGKLLHVRKHACKCWLVGE